MEKFNPRNYNLEPIIRLARENNSEVEQIIRLTKDAAVEIRIIVTPV